MNTFFTMFVVCGCATEIGGGDEIADVSYDTVTVHEKIDAKSIRSKSSRLHSQSFSAAFASTSCSLRAQPHKITTKKFNATSSKIHTHNRRVEYLK